MTVIAFDGTTLAGDRRVCTGDSPVGTCTKVFKVRDVLVGITGNLVEGEVLLKWFREGAIPNAFPTDLGHDSETFLYAFRLNCEVNVYTTRSAIPARFRSASFAAGSGQAYARAAMYCGRSAATAVAIACDFDLYSGDGIDTVTFDGGFVHTTTDADD